MSSSRRPSRRQAYQLYGASAGWIILNSGVPVYVGYNAWTDNNTQNLPHLRAALEYIAARVAERAHQDGQAFNNIQIRSMFHPTTMVGGERVMDPGGLHMTFDARAVLEHGVVSHDWRSGHAYVTGFPPTTQHADPENFYHQIELGSISWEDGTVETSSGSSHGTTPRGGSPGGGSSGSGSSRASPRGGSSGGGSARGSPRGGISGSSGSKSGGSQSSSATKSGTMTATSRSSSTSTSSPMKGSGSHSSAATKSATAKGSSHSSSATKSGSTPSSGRR